MADESDDMEIDDRSIEINILTVDGETYGIVEDEQGDVVLEGYTVDCRR